MLSVGHAAPSSPNSVNIDHYTVVLRHLPHSEFDHLLQVIHLCSQKDTAKQGDLQRTAAHGDLLCFFTADNSVGVGFLICSATKAKAHQEQGLVVLSDPSMSLVAVRLPFKVKKEISNADS